MHRRRYFSSKNAPKVQFIRNIAWKIRRFKEFNAQPPNKKRETQIIQINSQLITSLILLK